MIFCNKNTVSVVGAPKYSKPILIFLQVQFHNFSLGDWDKDDCPGGDFVKMRMRDDDKSISRDMFCANRFPDTGLSHNHKYVIKFKSGSHSDNETLGTGWLASWKGEDQIHTSDIRKYNQAKIPPCYFSQK